MAGQQDNDYKWREIRGSVAYVFISVCSLLMILQRLYFFLVSFMSLQVYIDVLQFKV